MRRMVCFVFLAVSCGGGDEATNPPGPPTDSAVVSDSASDVAPDVPSETPFDAAGEPKLTTKTFTASDEDSLNPERGLFDGGGIALVDTAAYEGIRKAGFAMAYGKVRLDKFRSSAIDKATLDALGAGFARVRKAGIKVVLRFVYNDPTTYPSTDPDASEAQILAHLKQLAPVLDANADVIAVMQAGFIGLWGEWHGSTNGLENPTSRKNILQGILAALPSSRMTAVRTPKYKSDWFAKPLTDAEGFGGSEQARIGHHNDCFLADATDMGTYETPVATWKDWLSQDTRFVPMGGESCNPNTLSQCGNALAEMTKLHWSYYNRYYHPGVWTQWVTGKCDGEIARRLGYRIELQEASWSEAVRPGGILVVRVKLRNVGFASMFNPRKVLLALDGPAGARMFAPFPASDPRKWEPGKETTFESKFRIPATATTGTWTLSLWLPDDAAAIRDRAEYAVRFANTGTWDATKGQNAVTDAFRIDAAAIGSADPGAKDFSPLP